jgi:hypothetical protein
VKNKDGRKNGSDDEFIAAARRAFKRVARQLRIENRRLGLPLISAKNGRVHLVRANGSGSSARRP